jgi:hypothetical protein
MTLTPAVAYLDATHWAAQGKEMAETLAVSFLTNRQHPQLS